MTWAVDFIFVQALRGDIPLQVSKQRLNTFVLVRRTLLYSGRKNKLQRGPDDPIAINPQNILQDVFGKPMVYHEKFRKGKRIESHLEAMPALTQPEHDQALENCKLRPDLFQSRS